MKYISHSTVMTNHTGNSWLFHYKLCCSTTSTSDTFHQWCWCSFTNSKWKQPEQQHKSMVDDIILVLNVADPDTYPTVTMCVVTWPTDHIQQFHGMHRLPKYNAIHQTIVNKQQKYYITILSTTHKFYTLSSDITNTLCCQHSSSPNQLLPLYWTRHHQSAALSAKQYNDVHALTVYLYLYHRGGWVA